MLSVVGRQCDNICNIFLPKLLRLGGTTPSCSKCCKSLKQVGGGGGSSLSNWIWKKYTRYCHTVGRCYSDGNIGRIIRTNTNIIFDPCVFFCIDRRSHILRCGTLRSHHMYNLLTSIYQCLKH